MTYTMKQYQRIDLPKVCGAKTRAGGACKNAVILPALRCSKHGGKTPIKHGKRSKLAQNIRRQAKLLRMEMRGVEKKLRKEVRG